MMNVNRPHLNVPIVSRSELRRVASQLPCDTCYALWFLDQHPEKGFCACECHLSLADLDYVKSRKGE